MYKFETQQLDSYQTKWKFERQRKTDSYGSCMVSKTTTQDRHSVTFYIKTEKLYKIWLKERESHYNVVDIKFDYNAKYS